MQISNLAKENKNERLKNETLVFVQTLLPSYAMGNINAIEEFLKQFRYTTIDSLPKDAKILDSSELTIEATVQQVLDWYEAVAK